MGKTPNSLYYFKIINPAGVTIAQRNAIVNLYGVMIAGTDSYEKQRWIPQKEWMNRLSISTRTMKTMEGKGYVEASPNGVRLTESMFNNVTSRKNP